MELARVIEYTDIFPEESGNLPDIRSLISGINRKHLVTLTSNMMSRLNERPFYDAELVPTSDNLDFVRFFLSGANYAFIQDIVHRYQLLESSGKKNGYTGVFLATRPAAIIRFQKYFFSLPPCGDMLSPRMEVDFFKAMLLVNQEVNSAYTLPVNKNNPLDLQIAEIYLSYNYSNEGIETANINDTFRRQLVRFSELICFLERQKRLKPLREKFRQHYRLGTLAQYMMPHILTSFMAGSKSAIHDMRHCNKLGRKVRYIMKMSSVPYKAIIEFDKNTDYIYFRANPYVEIEKHCYASISTPFVLEHIYESMYFQLKPYSVLSGFKSESDFRRYITTEFTQNWMFNQFVTRCLNGRENVAMSDIDCHGLIGGRNVKEVEPPDYYIREGNYIILFELKDTLASAKNKEMRNASDFFEELKEKFLENDGGRPKAVRQLMANVKSIQNGTFIFDKYAPADATIYPVIVVDSVYFTMRGIHTKLEYWMRDNCRAIGIKEDKVRPLILMDVSTLRLYADSFNKLGFVHCFEDYYKDIEWRYNPDHKTLLNSIKSFSEYMAGFPIVNMQGICRSVMKSVERGYKGC